MRIRSGTSGYSYKEWKGSFYPEKLAVKDMLNFYATRFGTVEINNTFYRMPNAATLEGWAAQVPDDFSFVLKASKRITHDKRLKDVADPLSYLLTTAAVLGPKLGPFLIQLPPFVKKDLALLTDFLALWPNDRRAAFEFRHVSWFEDDVFDALRARNAALCLAESGEPVDAPFIATADWGYLRLRFVEYSDADLEQWASRAKSQPWGDAYVFFKHEDEGTGPKLAARFMEICGASG